LKRLLIVTLLVLALALAGCKAIAPAPAPTYTPVPTYTPLPTYTPFPTATATFLPPPTEVVLDTPTPVVIDAPDVLTTPTSAGLQAVLAFGSNLREGPGKLFDVITRLSAGETLMILGRDVPGFWIFVRTATGLEGWVAVTQVQGPLDIPRIPLAQNIPTPEATGSPTVGTPGTPATASGTTTVTSTSLPSGTPGTYFFVITAGAPQQCETLTIGVPTRFHVDDINETIPPYNSENPASVVGVRVYRVFRTYVPAFIQLLTSGDMTPGDCKADNTCGTATFELCMSAPTTAPTGGTDYIQNITLAIGTQSYDQLFEEARIEIPTMFRVVAP
jgi:hypothetical protein